MPLLARGRRTQQSVIRVAPRSHPASLEDCAIAYVSSLFAIADDSTKMTKVEYVDPTVVSRVLILDRKTPHKDVQIKGVEYLGLNLKDEAVLMDKPLKEASQEAYEFFKSWLAYVDACGQTHQSDDSTDDDEPRAIMICSNSGMSIPALVCMQLLILAEDLMASEALTAAVAARPEIQLSESMLKVLKKVAGNNDDTIDNLRADEDVFKEVGGILRVKDEYIFGEKKQVFIDILNEIPYAIGTPKQIWVDNPFLKQK